MKFAVINTQYFKDHYLEMARYFMVNVTENFGVYPVPLFEEISYRALWRNLPTSFWDIKTEYCAVVPVSSTILWGVLVPEIRTWSLVSTKEVNQLWDKCIRDDCVYLIQESESKI